MITFLEMFSPTNGASRWRDYSQRIIHAQRIFTCCVVQERRFSSRWPTDRIIDPRAPSITRPKTCDRVIGNRNCSAADDRDANRRDRKRESRFDVRR